MILVIALLWLAACDYAKPTEVDKIDDRVTALEQRQGDQNITEQVEENASNIDSLLQYMEEKSIRDAINFIKDATLFVEGKPGGGVFYGGSLTVGGEALEGFAGHIYVMCKLEISESSEVTIIADGKNIDTVLEVIQLFPFRYFGKSDNDRKSPYGEDWDRSVYTIYLDPGTYWILLFDWWTTTDTLVEDYAVEVK